MKFTNHTHHSIAGIVIFVLCLSMSGCLPLPYYVSPDIEVDELAELPDNIILTVGPRELLEELGSVITNSYENIVVVDGLEFRDSAFPEGGWKLDQILDPAARQRITAQMGVRFLVIVGPDELTRGEEKGFFFPLLVGAMSQEKVSAISAVIIDMAKGEVVCQINSEAHATERTAAYVVFVAGTIPLTSASAIEGMAKAIGNRIYELVGTSNTRVAILATDTSFQDLKEMQQAQKAKEEEFKALLETAKNGEPDAQYNVYLLMRDKHIDPVVAWEWLCKSADQGYKKAQVEVGFWYKESSWEYAQASRKEWMRKAGVQTDNQVAYMWYTLAANGNDDRLRTINNLFSEKLTEEEIAQANDMVRSWKPGQCPTPYE